MKTRVDDYLRTLDRSENTRNTYRWALGYFLDLVGDDAPLDKDTYKAFLTGIKNLSPSSKRVCKCAVLGLYEFCDALDPGMAKLTKHYIRNAKPGLVDFDRPAVEKIIAHCENLRGDLRDLRDRAFVLTLADTGLRISEACSLMRGRIDFQEERTIITGKGGKQAVVRFSERSIAAIREYLDARHDGQYGKPLMTLPLFAVHHARGDKTIRKIGADGMRKAIKERMKEAGVDPHSVRIHDFRHYFVTVAMLASGGNLKFAAGLARHESVTTTQRYAHLTDTELDAGYDAIFNATRKPRTDI